MLEKEYLVCFIAKYEGETKAHDCYFKCDKLNKNKLEKLKEKLILKLNCESVVYTNIVCLGDVEDE